MALFLLFSGCSVKNPSEAEARKVFENKWAWHIQSGKVQVVDFKKTGEHSDKKVGIEFYTIEYEAVIKAVDFNFGDWQRLKMEGPVEKVNKSDDGELLKIWGQITFAKTGNRWKGEDGVVY